MQIVSHQQWCHGKPPANKPVAASKRKAFCIHYDGKDPTTRQGYEIPRGIYRQHVRDNDWDDIGYNFVIAQDGVIYEGRGWDNRGAHAPGGNYESIGVQVHIGGTQKPSEQARKSLAWLYNEANRRFGKTLEIKGHRDYLPTRCPGEYMYNNWVKKKSFLKPGLPNVGVSVQLVSTVSVAHLKKARYDDPPKSGTPLGPYANEVYTMETALAKTQWLKWQYVDGHFGSTTVGDGSSGYGGTTGFQKKHSGASNPDGWLGPKELTKLFRLANMNVNVTA